MDKKLHYMSTFYVSRNIYIKQITSLENVGNIQQIYRNVMKFVIVDYLYSYTRNSCSSLR
jgi:hypothetical protein